MPGADRPLFGSIRSLWEFLDVLCFFLSPLAIIGFITFSIIILDGFGQHVQFLRALEQNGVEASGAWYPPSEWGGYAYIAFAAEQNGQTGVVVSTKYYTRETLAALKKGQVVRVRYTHPPAYETKGVLLDAYGQVKGYTGYLAEILWPLLVSWAVVAVHPEFLYLGFIDSFKQGRFPAMESKP
jgi:hypothetical protein